MRILFLSQRVPYPPNRGDKITTWRLIERMARDHEVSVVAFAHDEADEVAVKHLIDKGFDTVAVRHRSLPARIKSLPLLLTKTPLTLGYYGSKGVQREVDQRILGADLVYAYSSSMGAFMVEHDKPRVMHFAELDSDKWRQYSERSGPPGRWIYGREARTLLEFERRVAAVCRANVLCTPLEEKIFQERIPGAPSIVLRNGVDLQEFRPDPDYAEPGRIVFTGVMNYLPNVDGCQWFTRRVFLRLLKDYGDVRFDIIGSHPSPEVEELGSYPNVRVTGFVPDTRTYLREGSISVAPLRIARGIQNKVLEALAMGLPVVGTTSATQGVEGEPGRDFLLADDEDSFYEAVKSLLDDPEKARELGRRGRAFVEENYDWEKCLAPLDGILAGTLP
ncbi:MAG: TIGR03087 family PEP-CTERM/XrtA system glycosyltransferase [Planctomycetota bacterium]